MLRPTLPLLTTAALVFAACGSDSGSSSDDIDLDGREFVASEVDGYDLASGTRIELRFDDGALGVNAGCNSMSGSYSLDGDTLEVGVMASTEMACEPERMDQDTWLASFLTSAPTVTLDGDVLELADDSGTTIELLDREVADPDRPIENTLWIVDGIITDEAVSTVPAGVIASVEIAAGTATVEAGCNSGTASVEVGDETLTFGPMAITRMLCPDDEMSVEDVVIQVLSGEVQYEIDAARLTLRPLATDATLGLNLVATS